MFVDLVFFCLRDKWGHAPTWLVVLVTGYGPGHGKAGGCALLGYWVGIHGGLFVSSRFEVFEVGGGATPKATL